MLHSHRNDCRFQRAFDFQIVGKMILGMESVASITSVTNLISHFHFFNGYSVTINI